MPWITIAMIACLAACRCSSKESKMNERQVEPTAIQCWGRFCFDVPVSMVRNTGEYAVRGLTVWECEFEPPLQDAWKRTWNERIAEIERLRTKRASPTDPRGTILEQRELIPGLLRAVLYVPDVDDESPNWAALLNSGPRGLWIEVSNSTAWIAAGRSREFKEEAVTLIREVAKAYTPRTPDEAWPVPGKDWFYLNRGAIALPTLPGAWTGDEETDVTFSSKDGKVEFEVETRIAVEPDSRGMLQQFMDAAADLGAHLHLSPSKHRRKRKVAGLEGGELIIRDLDKGEVVFMWRFSGEASSGSRPKAELSLNATRETLEERQALWNRMLDSMRPAAGR